MCGSVPCDLGVGLVCLHNKTSAISKQTKRQTIPNQSAIKLLYCAPWLESINGV